VRHIPVNTGWGNNMKFSIGQRLINTPTSAHQAEPVGRVRANAGPPAWEALKKVMANRTSAAEHCKQSLLKTIATSGKQALHNIKSQASSGWIKGVDDRVLPPNLLFDRPIGSHRSPELARGKMTVKTVNIDSASEKIQTAASFIDPRDVFFTPAPIAHKIEILEMQKPQSAVFVKVQTIKADFELGAARMRPPTDEPEEKA